MEEKNKKKDPNQELIKENIILKSKIAYSLGSLETVNYLLKNDDPVMLYKNIEHLRSTVNRVLEDLRKNS